jgi:hypothetical protein
LFTCRGIRIRITKKSEGVARTACPRVPSYQSASHPCAAFGGVFRKCLTTRMNLGSSSGFPPLAGIGFLSESAKISLSDLHPYDRVTFLRGKAIESYSALESSQAMLFHSLIGTDVLAAWTVFYRIVNTKSRNTILDSLLKQRRGSEFKAFWDSISSRIRSVDQRRHEIAHWQHAASIDAHGNTHGMIVPNNIFAHDGNTPKRTEIDLAEFCRECNFLSRTLNMFSLLISEKLGVDHPERKTWLDIFHSPITYPPQPTHPLHRIVQEHAIQLRPSQS